MKKESVKKSAEIFKYIRNRYDYVIIFLLYFAIHLFMTLNCWDDYFYKVDRVYNQYSFLGFLVRQYKYWTSRIVIEAAMYIFSWLPSIVWRVVDSLMIVLLYHSISCIIALFTPKSKYEKKYRVCQMLLFLSFPYALMATAGWLTTSINWTWMLAFSLYGIKVLLYSFTDSMKIRKGMNNLFFCVAFIYATNFDVVAIVMFCLLVILGFACYKYSGCKINKLYWEGIIITVINLILFVVCPGNRVRMSQDAIIHNTAEVLSLSVFGKIRMGINSTFYHFVSIPNAVLATTCVILLIAIFLQKGKLINRIVVCLPLIIMIGWTVYVFFAYTVKNRTLTYIYPDASFNVCPKIEQYLAITSALLLVVLIAYLLKQIVGEVHLYLFILTVFLVWGLLPEIILGFTATISASILRVVAFFYLALIFTSCLIIQRTEMLRKVFVYRGIMILGYVGTIMNFLQMIRHIMVYG